MLIISKYHDYYDSALGVNGVDKTIVYERIESDIQSELSFKEIDLVPLGQWRNYPTYEYFILGFCGKLYVGLVNSWEEKDKSYFLGKEVKSKIYYGNELLGVEKNRELNDRYYRKLSREKLSNLLQNYHEKEYSELFCKYRTPTFISFINGCKKEKGITINPVLKNYDVFKLFDSFTAFQSIESYISGVLGSNEHKLIEISNNDKIRKHGFDLKWSFRKEKQK